MKRIWKRAVGLLLALAVGMMPSAYGTETAELDEVLEDTGQVLLETVKTPQYGSVGGEWAVLGLARSGIMVRDGYYQGYYDALTEYVAGCGGELHARKYTEYSRVILALSALGADARNVAGYDLTEPLQNYDKTVWQGVNGPIYALLALDSRNYPAPEGLRQQYIDYILSCQLSDGGWSLSGTASDPDLTGMALQALAKYQEQDAVRQATEKALDGMSNQQSMNGGFSAWGTAASESCAQMIVALCELGINLDDPRFVKEGHTLLDGLLVYYEQGKGFRHALTDTDCSQMATEQAFYALTALKRTQEGETSLYRMEDVPKLVCISPQAEGQFDAYTNVLIRVSLWSALAIVGIRNPQALGGLLSGACMGGTR